MTLPHLLMNHERGTPIIGKQYDGDLLNGHVVKCYNLPAHICGEGILYYLLDVEKNAGFEIKKVLRPVKEETNLYPWKVICNEQFASFLLQKEKIQIYDDSKRNNRILVRLPRGKDTNGGEASTEGEVDRGGDAPKKEDTKGSIFRFINPRKNEVDGGDSAGDPSCYSNHVVSSSQNYDSNEVKKMNEGIFDADSITIGEAAPRGDCSHGILLHEFERDPNQTGNGVEYCLYEEPPGGDDGNRSDDSDGDLSNDEDSNWFGSESSFAMDGEDPYEVEKDHAEEGEKYEESYRSSNYINVKQEKGEKYYQGKDSFKYIGNRNSSNTSDTKSGSELKSLVSSSRNDDTSVRNEEEGIITTSGPSSNRHGSIVLSDWAKTPHGGTTQENKNNLITDQMDEHTRRSRKKNPPCDAIEGIISEQKELFKKIKRRKKMKRRGIEKINIYFCPGSIDEMVREIREEDAGVSVPTVVDFPLEEKRQFLLDVYGWSMEDHHHQEEHFHGGGSKIKLKMEKQNEEEEEQIKKETKIEEDPRDPNCHNRRERPNREETSKMERPIREDPSHNDLHEDRTSQISLRSMERRPEGSDSKRGGSTIWPSHLGWKEISEEIKSKLCVVIKNKPAEWSDYDLRKFIESQFAGSNHVPVFEDIFLTKSCPTIATVAFKNEKLREHFLKCQKFKLPSSFRRYADDGNRGGGNRGGGKATACYHYNGRYSNFITLQEYIVSHNAGRTNNAKKKPNQRKDGSGYTFREKYKAKHSEAAPARMGESTNDDSSRSGRYQSRKKKYATDMRSRSRHDSMNRQYDGSETNKRTNQYGKHDYHVRS
ncbi:Uncharacterized protein PCOAH_00010270 [Plasmodium coatneyi]|uniref:Uncharacterized protein n=1 Tax=Plasmodium coatneyi TaxID=208452 RepID=A0A1B1DVK5_9APIC|nr:Uncharacterized protein PCOAH_00010270 [Plasmodium coatneyi]ANQ06821.1 Uncharacterized protein PCOAH_00010270 [Plasmodium coatneyi]